MSADILDELELMRFTRIDPIRENAILKRAKDEIGRLRGEVEAWSKSYDRAVELGQQHRVRAERMEVALLGFPEEPNPYTYRIAYAKARATIAGVGITEQQKADRDLLLYGTSFMRDGKRIDPATVRIETPAPAMPNGVEGLLSQARAVLERFRAQDDDAATVINRIDALRAADNRDAAGVDRSGITPVFRVCTAYESGVGKGMQGRDLDNPYKPDTDEHEAWAHGFAEGRERSGDTPAAVPAGEATIAPAEANGDLSALERLAWNWKNIDVPLGDVGSSATLERCANELRAVIATMTIPQPAGGEAVVPAGEAVATEKNVHTEHCCREHGCKYGEAACPVELGQQVQSHPCEDCTPQPADGEAVEFVAVPDDYRNQASGYRAGWTDAMNAAPVQAAPQEGEVGRVCGYTPGMGRVEIQLEGNLPDWLELGQPVHVSALQHRGDSRGGEG